MIGAGVIGTLVEPTGIQTGKWSALMERILKAFVLWIRKEMNMFRMKNISRIAVVAATVVLFSTLGSITVFASEAKTMDFSQFVNAQKTYPGATREERYMMAEYGDNDDLAILKQSRQYVKDHNGIALDSEFLHGTQIMEYKNMEGGWRYIGTIEERDILQDDYDGLRYTNCYILEDGFNADIVFNYGVYFNPAWGEYGANYDQTGYDPVIFHGNNILVEANPDYAYSYPFIGISATSDNGDQMLVYQFTKASDGRDYAFGKIIWNDGVGTEYRFMLARP